MQAVVAARPEVEAEVELGGGVEHRRWRNGQASSWSFADRAANCAGETADPPGDIRELKLRDWEPKSMMVTKTTIVEKPLYPVIDVHNHLGGGKERLTPATVKRYLTEMDEAGVQDRRQPRRRLGRPAQGDARRTRRGPPRPLPHVRPRQLRRHRRPGLGRARGQAARRELQGRGQGAEVPQDARPRATATRTAS